MKKFVTINKNGIKKNVDVSVGIIIFGMLLIVDANLKKLN